MRIAAGKALKYRREAQTGRSGNCHNVRNEPAGLIPPHLPKAVRNATGFAFLSFPLSGVMDFTGYPASARNIVAFTASEHFVLAFPPMR